MRKLSQWTVVALVACAIGLWVVAMSAPAQAAPGCICPMVYSPVKCSNGKTYSNLCVAKCNKATGCVPVIVVPPPI